MGLVVETRTGRYVLAGDHCSLRETGIVGSHRHIPSRTYVDLGHYYRSYGKIEGDRRDRASGPRHPGLRSEVVRMTPYPHLLTPGWIGGLELSSRVIMSPMATTSRTPTAPSVRT